MKIKNFSIAAHLIHSRIEMASYRFMLTVWMDRNYMLEWNGEYFKKAAAAVTAVHGIQCTKEDLLQAAELYIITIQFRRLKRYYVIEELSSDSRSWSQVGEYIASKIQPVDPDERMTNEEAAERLSDFIKIFGNGNFRVSVAWETLDKYYSEKDTATWPVGKTNEDPTYDLQAFNDEIYDIWHRKL